MAQYESAVDTAKKIRARLQREFPNYPKKHFSITTKTYSGGSSLDVKWKDNPSYDEVTAIVNSYNSYSFDGMTDSGETHGYLDEDGIRYSGAKFLRTERVVSEERKEAVNEYIRNEFDAEYADEIINGQGSLAIKYRKYVDYFDDDNKVKKEHVEKNIKDIKSFRENIINEFIQNVPIIGMYNSCIFLIGKPHKEPKTGEMTIRITNSQVENKIRSLFDKEVPVTLLEQIYGYSRNDHSFKKGAELELRSAFQQKLALQLERETMNKLTERFFKNVGAKGSTLKALVSKEESEKYLKENFYLEDDFYLGIDNDVDLSSYANGFDIVDAYVNNDFKSKYGDLETKKAAKENLSEDEIVCNLIEKSIKEFSPLNKERFMRIMTKKDNEIVKFIDNSPDKMKNTQNFKQILKYEFEPKENKDYKVDIKITIYQTAFGMWLSMVKDNEKPNIRNIYKLGNQTIEQSVKAATIIAKTYNLSPNIITLAKKMYLKG